MSIRTLIEINHDYAHRLDAELLQVLTRYLASGDKKRSGPDLERYGIRIVASRHHSGNFYIDPETDGFPADMLRKTRP